MAFLQKAKQGLFSLMLGAVAAAASAPAAQAVTPLGTDVTNVAELTFDTGDRRITVPTNPAVFQVVAQPTPSSIDFFRYSPNSPDALSIFLHGSDLVVDGGFEALPTPVTLGGIPVDVSGPVPLVQTDRYLSGELLIVRITDRGQNGDPGRIETVIGTVASDAGDAVTLRFYESGPDTGEFFAYLRTDGTNRTPGDAILGAPRDSQLTATYVDRFDSTEVSIDTALVDPYGRVFDALTGEVIDGARVTLIDVATGLPAEVFGIDGVSAYPSTIVTGGTVTDASGLVYELDPGEYLFPLIAPGDYRLEVEPPETHRFPSIFDAADFVDLPNAPYEIVDASYGELLVVDGSRALTVDIPVDGGQTLTVRKQTGVSEAAVGDFVRYQVVAENSNSGPMPFIIRDLLPNALRYVEGSARVDGDPIDDPEISADGMVLTFRGPRIDAGDTRVLSYVLAVGAGSPEGDVINRALAVSPAGNPLSNTAEAVIRIGEDLFRSRLTIVGRVAENACEADDPWARPLEDGLGVPGVRLYLETGEYVVTDQDGLYHFQGVEEGTHVVRLDPATLPAGYEPMICEENTRYAGKATSQFVDARGGTVWRANFYLKRTGDVVETVEEAEFNDQTEYKDYDQAWLDAQTSDIDWVYPNIDRTPSAPSVNIGIKVPFGTRGRLVVNGLPVRAEHVQESVISTDRTKVILRWRGVALIHGENRIEVKLTDAEGNDAGTLDRTLWFVTEADEARLVDDQSVLVADGRTNPVIAIRLEDLEGRAVFRGQTIDIDVPTPYRLASEDLLDEFRPAGRTAPLVEAITVGNDGIARIELAPTLETGRLRLQVPLRNNRVREIEVYLEPEKRDWIVVGLADGTLALEDGDMNRSGRVAFFAKGMVKGDWLLTVAIDTAERRGQTDRTVFNRIDPQAYYTLYGDRTFQGNDAESQYPVFVKLEKQSAMLMFGDFNTDLADSELLRYNRRLTGVKTDYVTDRFEATGFASETNQRFVKDELPADGTSGPFQLADAPLVRNSEILVVETRDRFRPDEVVSINTLSRDRDYEIDYTTGVIRLRAPLPATDLDFNPNVIVADYETINGGERGIIAGGRAAVRTFDGRVETGASVIRDENTQTGDTERVTLAGVDVLARIDENTEIRAEIGTSVREASNAEVDESGTTSNAFLVEGIHTREWSAARAYLRQEDGGFGLGQTGSNTRSTRRMGVDGDLILSESIDPRTNATSVSSVTGNVYREENLDSDEHRDLAEVRLQQTTQTLSTGIGFRGVSESLEAGDRQSVLGTVNARKSFPDMGLALGVSHEAPLSTNSDERNAVTLFPERTILSADKSLFRGVNLNLRHEITDGNNASGTNTLAGLSASPWQGARLSAGLDQFTQESGRRLASNIAVDQQVQLTKAWSASLGWANRARIDGNDRAVNPVADAAISPFDDVATNPLTADEGFNSAYLGVGYLEDVMAISSRLEFRNTASETRHALDMGAARELSEKLSFGAAARIENFDRDGTEEATNADIRLGAAYRPRGEGLIVFDRFDVDVQDNAGAGQTVKLVNNLSVNSRIGDATQASAFWGVKHVTTEISEQKLTGWTNLIGGELRHDITRRVDVGVAAAVMHTTSTGTSEVSVGPSIGFSPRENIWASVGYNFTGFHDADFEAAEYTREGVNFKFRLKFDEDTVSGLLKRITPTGSYRVEP